MAQPLATDPMEKTRTQHMTRLAPGVIMTWAESMPASEAGEIRPAVIQYKAESLAALVAHVTSDNGRPMPPFTPESRDNPPDEAWDLKAGWAGALEISKAGWPKGRAEIRAALAQIPGDMILCPPQLADVAGGVLDCAAHVAGAPDCFDVDDDDAPGRARVVRLIVPLSASCSVPAKKLMHRGAAIASIIDALEAGGIQCEIEALSVHESNTDNSQVTVRHMIKHAGEPLNLDALATSICHPATFRRLHFAALESIGHRTPLGENAWRPAKIKDGYGTPGRFLSMDLEQPGAFLIPSYRIGAYETPAQARESVAAGMRELGFNVTFEPAAAPSNA